MKTPLILSLALVAALTACHKDADTATTDAMAPATTSMPEETMPAPTMPEPSTMGVPSSMTTPMSSPMPMPETTTMPGEAG